jgi:thiamine phosphate synthase YjbQ (UPF0047 family)
MISYRKELHFNLPKRRGLVNITGDVEKALAESGISEGLILVNAMNITASVFINDDEGGLHQDMKTGWKNWHRKNHIVSIIIMDLKITLMVISNEPLWAAKQWWQ